MLPTEFLAAIFRGLSSELLISLWNVRDKQTQWIRPTPEECLQANDWAKKNSSAGNALYFGACAYGEVNGSPPPGRGRETHVRAVPGLWIDLDFAGPSKKKNYPDSETARSLLAECPSKPSVIVFTGGGFHVYWLFEEPLLVPKAADRKHAKAACQALQTWFRENLDGKAVDSTHDLTRVLRPAGTFNHLAGEAVDVCAAYLNPQGWIRYESIYAILSPLRVDPADMIAEKGPGGPASERKRADATPGPSRYSGPLEVNSERHARTLRYEVLRDNYPEFKQVWDGRRTYESQSEADLALASCLAYAGCSDQEIVDFLVSFRTKRQANPEKLWEHPKYVTWTLERARKRGETASNAPRSKKAAEDAADESTPEEDFEQISSIVGVKVLGWLQYGIQDAIYSVIIEGHEPIEIGKSVDFMSGPRAFRAAIYDAADYVMPDMTKGEWRELITLLARNKTVANPEEASSVRQIDAYVGDYLRNSLTQMQNSTGSTQAAVNRNPFLKEGQVYFAIDPLGSWLRPKATDKWPAKRIGRALRDAGYENVIVKTIDNSTRSYWRIDCQRFTFLASPEATDGGDD